jgi:hypothetical protein
MCALRSARPVGVTEPAGATEPAGLPRRWRPDAVWLAWALWVLAMLAIAAAAWLDHLLRQSGRPDLTVFDAAGVSVQVAHLGLATLGAVVASRRPGNPVGWLILAFGILGQGSFVISAYADYGLLVRPGALPAARLVASYFPADAVTSFACLAFILLLTPTGSLLSPRWRPWTVLIAATTIGLLLTVALTPALAGYRHPRDPFDLHNAGGAQLLAYQIAFPVILLAVVSGALSLLVRFHRAVGTERLQLRWVSLAAGLVALVLVVFLVSLAAGVPSLPDPGLVGTVCLAILTLGIGAATLGYRLYDLDRIISRTLAYGLLTVLLGGGYAAVAVGLSQLASGQSNLTVALATLVLAVAFRPARRRVQDLVDRHFNRRRYDAAQTIGAFAARLQQQPDLDRLTDELLAVVDQTIEPANASLWLAPGPERRAGI